MYKSVVNNLIRLQLIAMLMVLGNTEVQLCKAGTFETVACSEEIECKPDIPCLRKIDKRDCTVTVSGLQRIDPACEAEKAMLNTLYQIEYEKCLEDQKWALDECERKRERHLEVCQKYKEFHIDASYEGSLRIADHFLIGKDIEYFMSPNTSGAFSEGYPDSIVIHTTYTSNFDTTLRYLSSSKARSSSHLLIGRDGRIAQLVPFNYRAWHAGKGSYAGRTGFNQYAIGINLVNAGKLDKVGDRFITLFRQEIPSNQVFNATHKHEVVPGYWQKYTDIQIQTLRKVCILLAQTHKIEMIIGHEDLAPGRKLDPGPAFPDMTKFRASVVGH